MIRERPDGRWEARITLPDGRLKSVYAATRRKVLAKRDELQRAVEAGLPLSDEKLTVAAYLDEWLVAIQPTVRDTTYQRHIEFVRLHIVPALGNVRLSKLTARQVQDFYAERLRSGLSPTTVNHLHATLHKALGAAVRMDLVARNVSALALVPPAARHEIRPLSPEQARRFVEVVAGERDEALFVLALTSGMRQGEILALRWRDVDLEHRTLHVRFSIHQHRQTGEWALTEPKTARSRRQIALSRLAVAALEKHHARQEDLRRMVGGVGPAAQEDERWCDLVFPDADGGPRPADSVYHQLRRMLAGAGLPRIRFHDLRHTCATLLLKARVDAKVVADLLGHASVAITLDIYAHVLPDMLRDAVAAITAALDTPIRPGGAVGTPGTRGREVVAVADLVPQIVCPHCGVPISGATSGATSGGAAGSAPLIEQRVPGEKASRASERANDEDQDRDP